MGRPAGAPLGAANSSSHVQVLGAGAREGGAPSAPSVLLFFDRARYLFNAGEGFQRFCVERRVRLARLSAVFATRVGADATGGLPGMLLTMADTSCGGLLAGHAALALHGPRGLQALVGAFRTFVNVRDLGLRVREFPDAVAEPVLQNELVAITPVVLRPEGAPPAAAAAAVVADAAADAADGGGEDAEDADGGEPGAKRPRLSNCAAAAGAAANGAAAAAPTSVACYVCALPEVAGKFLPARAAALGVPRGPAYGALVRGEAVAAVSGRMVQPAEVMEAPTPGPVVLVVDCPSAAYVGALADAEAGLGKWAADAEAREKGASGGWLGGDCFALVGLLCLIPPADRRYR
jgi:ribonuclease Z